MQRQRAMRAIQGPEDAIKVAGYPIENRDLPDCCSRCGRPLDSVTVVGIEADRDRRRCPECRVHWARTFAGDKYFAAQAMARQPGWKDSFRPAPGEYPLNQAAWHLRVTDSVRRNGHGAAHVEYMTIIESIEWYRNRTTMPQWGRLAEVVRTKTDFGEVFIANALDGLEIGRVRVDEGKDLVALVLQHLELAGFEMWHHVSASFPERAPTYDELALVKRQFIGPDRECYSVWAPREEHVNDHPFCHHLWHSLSLSAGRRGEVLPRFGHDTPNGVVI